MTVGVIICLLLMGAFGGFCAGLLGVGGGMILVPFLTLLFSHLAFSSDLAVHSSIATSMAMIFFTSISSMMAHHRKGAVLWPVAFSLVPGILLGGIAAGQVFSLLNTTWLALIFALFVFYSAYNMLRNKQPKPSRTLPGFAGRAAVGGVVGFVSGLVGAGGGFMSVPFMIWCNVSARNAVATSAALGLPIAIANSIGYIVPGIQKIGIGNGMIGYVYWPALIVLVLMSIITAPLGAKLAHQLPVAFLKKIFAGLLFVLATMMVYKAFTS